MTKLDWVKFVRDPEPGGMTSPVGQCESEYAASQGNVQCEMPYGHVGTHRYGLYWWNEPITPMAADEKVNHPKHYGGDTVYEAIKVIEAWDLGFNLGNAVKYICRAGKKPGSVPLEDLEKAQFYLNREVENLRAAKGEEDAS